MSARSALSTLLVCCCVLYSAHAQSEVDAGVTEDATMLMTSAPATTEEPITEFSIRLYHRESSTSSISIVWRPRMPEGVSINKYHIETRKKGSDSLITSPDLPGNTTSYIVKDLIKAEKWHVCVVAAIKNETSSDVHEQCLESFTIPYIRDDSVYVLAIVILVIAALIFIGYFSWRCAVNAAEKRAAEAEADEEDETDEGKLLTPQQAKPILLSPVDNSPDRPKSSIEEEDIPFITPPWSEIEKEERERAHKAGTNNVA